MKHRVRSLHALEILDSRARPTLEVTVTLESGAVGTFGVPAGASTGGAEAVELRDRDPSRYGGQGVTKAVAAVQGEIAKLLVGRSFDSLETVDRLLIDLDGTADKHRLGANAIVGVSVATAKALAVADGQPLWQWLAGDHFVPSLPVPYFNVVNGGAHARNRLAFQEFMVAPVGAGSFAEALRVGVEIYLSLRAQLQERGLEVGLGDEGGFAPEIERPEDVLELLRKATESAGYEPSLDQVAFALDPAANGFQSAPGRYRVGADVLTSSQMVDYYETLLGRFPLCSIEDGLAEDDRGGWKELTRRLGSSVQLVGDDNFVTNAALVASAQAEGIANSALIKVNQVGTVTETLETIDTARRGGYRTFVSHRSGETTDTFIADLTVGTGSGQLKSGAPARGERVAKYNRLLRIEAETSLAYAART